ncbi:hypothetical protein MKW98_016315 [Papaver atlanticum]|uniref:Uncharacterized protein n=1 Tax=Papaver atlanticum TaxID=357466 RepID=A0AAD4SHE2_9MAGN|nr:hypothetical protein MKW98_016315 [Papaver atlanticum]
MGNSSLIESWDTIKLILIGLFTNKKPITAVEVLQLAVSLGTILAMDKFLKQAFVAASIQVPERTIRNVFVFYRSDVTVPSVASNLVSLFAPANLFIQRWVPVTEMVDSESTQKPSPFSSFEVWVWTVIFVSSFVAAYVNPIALGTSALTCLPFLLAAIVLGYMVGTGLPSAVKIALRPIISCTLSELFAEFSYGYFSGSGFDALAITNGILIISFAFSMFEQRKGTLVKRHAAEIFTSVIISTIFLLYSTALIGRLITHEILRSLKFRSTGLKFLRMCGCAVYIGANASLTAATVVVTGLVGANFVQVMLDKLRLKDPIARGTATACLHLGKNLSRFINTLRTWFGTAGLSAKEPV